MTFFTPPTDPQIVALPDDGDAATQRIVKHLKTHGFTTVSQLARDLKMPRPTVDHRFHHFRLKRTRVLFDSHYWGSMGYTLGRISDISPEALVNLKYHIRDGESFAGTIDRLLRGDAQPHRSCCCGFCIRSRARPGHDGREV